MIYSCANVTSSDLLGCKAYQLPSIPDVIWWKSRLIDSPAADRPRPIFLASSQATEVAPLAPDGNMHKMKALLSVDVKGLKDAADNFCQLD